MTCSYIISCLQDNSLIYSEAKTLQKLVFTTTVSIEIEMLFSIFITILYLIINICHINALNQNEMELLKYTADMKDESAIGTMADLLLQGVDANIRSDDGESVLHLSCIWGNPMKIKLLLESGANPNARANQTPGSLNMTPLSWCAYGGHTAAVSEFLSDDRTNINLIVRQEDGGYITALDIAYKVQEMGVEIVQLLENAGGKRFEQLRSGYEHVEDMVSYW